MKLTTKNIIQSLNKAYNKQSVHRDDLERFKSSFSKLFSRIDENESEEHLKNILSDFLKDSFYKETNEINVKDRKDLVIHIGKTSHTPVGIIMEVKKSSNTPEMVSREKPNAKALHELLLYFMRERIDNNNKEVKYLIATNIYDWFIFDALDFEKWFVNSRFAKEYSMWKQGMFSGTTTDWFYKEVAKPYVFEDIEELNCTHFNLKLYEPALKGKRKDDDEKLTDLYKIFSPQHFLKQSFANDSNSLNKDFYNELLHILGLEETRDGSKKLINRKAKEKRDDGSLIENAINELDVSGTFDRIAEIEKYGATYDEQIYSVALELCITWLNRILFLKLLEGQLLIYHKGNKDYAFLSPQKIKEYDELNELFFEVLAVKTDGRKKNVKQKYGNIPYLNSSLFETTELEETTIRISELKDRLTLPIHYHTVLKDDKGKRVLGEKLTLHYLFEFLDSFDFSSDSTEKIQEENKTLINASVLGLIFEKINGYKDGSYFTPGYITMYMCRETIRKAVVQKFNEHINPPAPLSKRGDKSVKGENGKSPLSERGDLEGFKDLTEIYNAIGKSISVNKANEIIDSLKICDPAVGSGHFLVSALNEIIAIKSELEILCDGEFKTLKNTYIEVVNDELIITDSEGNFFEYNYKDKSSQRIQETLFHEKEKIIENCLFGVDINPKSVMICQLRLWIELLKNSYYTKDSNYTELETLPNIDINIKCGNSLISRYDVNADLSDIFKKDKGLLSQYKLAVETYKSVRGGDAKKDLKKLIDSFKDKVIKSFYLNHPLLDRLHKLKGQLALVENKAAVGNLFEKLSEKDIETDVNKLKKQIQKTEEEIEDVKNNKVYTDALEWRFEFPEVIEEDGRFMRFDIVIGNPPYGHTISENKEYFIKHYISAEGKHEILKYFIEKGLSLLRKNGMLSYITSDTWTSLGYFKKLRKLIYTDYCIKAISKSLYNVFETATVDTNIYFIEKSKPSSKYFLIDGDLNSRKERIFEMNDEYVFNLKDENIIVKKIENSNKTLDEFCEIWQGLIAYGSKNQPRKFTSDRKETKFHRKLLYGGDISKYNIVWSGEYLKYGDWLHRPRPRYIYDNEKILIQRIRNPQLKNRLVCAIDSSGFINGTGSSNILLKDKIKNPSLKYLLSLLNSKLINYWFSYYFIDVNIKPEQLRKIPIKTTNSEKQFVSIVERVISAKKENAKADTSELEKKIDKMVYELYGLTEEEIKIVEG